MRASFDFAIQRSLMGNNMATKSSTKATGPRKRSRSITSGGSLLLTTNLSDYALAISVHHELAETRGFDRVYPFLLSPDQATLIKPLLRYYGLAQVDFSRLFDA